MNVLGTPGTRRLLGTARSTTAAIIAAAAIITAAASLPSFSGSVRMGCILRLHGLCAASSAATTATTATTGARRGSPAAARIRRSRSCETARGNRESISLRGLGRAIVAAPRRRTRRGRIGSTAATGNRR
jgi:hypothetical protein